VKFLLEGGQYFLVVLPIEFDFPLGWYFAELFEVFPVELNLNPIGHKFLLNHLVPLLHNNVFLCLDSELILQFVPLCPDVAILFVELGEHHFKGVNLVGGV
jgi:hypothetical protein